MGDIRIDNVNGTDLKNGGTFTNSANIIIGANTVVPFIQAFSSGLYQEDNGTFKNINCTGVLTTYDKIYDYFNRINNLGEVIIEHSNWNSTINSNSGVVQYLNGGLFTIRTRPNQVLDIRSTSPTTCSPVNGSITIIGLRLSLNYTLRYTFEGSSTTVITSSNARREITIPNLSVGIYDVSLGGICPAVLLPMSVTITGQTTSPPTVFVTPDGAGARDGISWSNASAGSQLQRAINRVAGCGAQVWVASGVYLIQLLYRATIANNTSDNSYHVINNPGGLNKTVVLNGFVITGGNANAGSNGYGAGIYNNGANGQVCSPTLQNCLFQFNSASLSGGAIYNSGTSGTSSPAFINCAFQSNSATYGGAILNDGNYGTANPLLTDCSFQSNSASYGGAIFNTAVSGISNTTLVNCVMFSNGGANTLKRTTVIEAYNNMFEYTVTGYTYTNSYTRFTFENPFVSSTSTQLAINSPTINAGDNGAYLTLDGPATDLAGNVRIKDVIIGLGAYEGPLLPDLTPILYALPATQYGTTNFTIVVDVCDLLPAVSNGLITLFLTKNPLVNLSFNPGSVLVGGKLVQNSIWSFNNSNDDFYIFTTYEVIAGKGHKSVGLMGVLRPGNTKGTLTISTTIVANSGGEVRIDNNSDADKIDYFKK